MDMIISATILYELVFVCSRCGTPLEVYEWPMKVEDIKEEGVYKSKYASIYKKTF
ncbi:MAG: hypothetical protein ACTSP3_12910 [Candidatus Heimdallarchaeaceae archaeon]